MRQIPFDKDLDYDTVFDALDRVLFSSGRKGLSIDLGNAGETRLLFMLLQCEAMKIYECDCLYKSRFEEEFQREADKIADILQKRSVKHPLYNALHMLSEYTPDLNRTLHNALYYPELKAYLRCGDLSPEKLFDLLAAGDCDKVILFHDTVRAEPPLLPSLEAFYVIQTTFIPGEKIAVCIQQGMAERLIKVILAAEKQEE